MEYPTPSVGRQVWYYPAAPEKAAMEDNETYDLYSRPWAATVIYVEGPDFSHNPFSPVNLLAINPLTGEQVLVTGVQHSPEPIRRDRFAWMPYQLQQHAKSQDQEKVRSERACGYARAVEAASRVFTANVPAWSPDDTKHGPSR